jgi:predicted dehydrogenase
LTEPASLAANPRPAPVTRILIVGLGSIGRRHARLARELLPDAEITALRHARCSDGGEPGVDHCVTTLSAALRRRPQAAVVANPAPYHLDVACPLADAGVHLLVEKPIASTSAGVSDLIAVSQARGVALLVGYDLRFSEALQHFRVAVHRGLVGRVLSVRAEVGQFLPTWRPQVDYRQTVSARAALGGGVLLELSHDLDYLRWVFGEVDWVSAVQRKQSDLDVDVEDTAHLTLGFAGRATGPSLVGTLTMDFVRRDITRTCVAIGERGTLRWDGIAGTVEHFGDDNVWRTIFAPLAQGTDSYVAEWRNFLACITEGASPVVTGADGLAALRVVEASRRSSNAECVVRVEHT